MFHLQAAESADCWEDDDIDELSVTWSEARTESSYRTVCGHTSPCVSHRMFQTESWEDHFWMLVFLYGQTF